MEHSLHLGAGHFVRGVAPTLSCKILKKVHTYDSDQLDAELTDSEDKDNVIKERNGKIEFDVADSVRKALTLVNQVSIYTSKGFCLT